MSSDRSCAALQESEEVVDLTAESSENGTSRERIVAGTSSLSRFGQSVEDVDLTTTSTEIGINGEMTTLLYRNVFGDGRGVETRGGSHSDSDQEWRSQSISPNHGSVRFTALYRHVYRDGVAASPNSFVQPHVGWSGADGIDIGEGPQSMAPSVNVDEGGATTNSSNDEAVWFESARRLRRVRAKNAATRTNRSGPYGRQINAEPDTAMVESSEEYDEFDASRTLYQQRSQSEVLGPSFSQRASVDLDNVSIEMEPEPLPPSISDPVDLDDASVEMEPIRNVAARSREATSSESEEEGFIVPTYRVV